MTSPMFQKSGPYSGDAGTNPSGRKAAPTLVFRQNSSRPLLLNSQSVASNFKSAFAANKYSSYRLKHAPQTNTSAPPHTNKVSTNQKVSECTEAASETSFTPLAQYFTFTGRLNPVPEVKTGNLENQNRSKVIEKFETNSYKLKLRSQEAKADSVEEIDDEEKRIFTLANGAHIVHDTFDNLVSGGSQENDHSEKQKCSEMREVECDWDMRRPHTEMSSRKVDLVAAMGLENENGSIDNNPDSRTFIISAREEKRRPQSAAMSYALHKQEATTTTQNRPSGPANGNGGNSIHSAAPPNPFLRGVPIPPKKENCISISTSGDVQTAPLSARQFQNNGNAKNGQSTAVFYNNSNSNRGVSVFNSKSILIQPRIQKNSSNPMISPDRSKVNKSSMGAESSSDSSSQQPMSYLQRINSGKLIPTSSQATKPKTSEMSLVSNEVDYNIVNSNGKSSNNIGATFQLRYQSENNLTSGSNLASNSQPMAGEQKENNISGRTSYSNKPIQYVKPMIRGVSNSNLASEKGDNKGSESVQDENTVVVKVLKKSNSYGAQKSQASHGDVKRAGRSVSEFSRIKNKDRSNSTENLAVSNQNGDVAAKMRTRDSSLNRTQKTSKVTKEKAKSVGQLAVSRKPAPAPPIPPRRPLCQLEQMHNSMNESSVSNVAPISEQQQKYPGIVRSSSRIEQTTITKRSSFRQSQEDSFETVASTKSNRLNRGSSVKASQNQRAPLHKLGIQAGDLMRNGCSYSPINKSFSSSAPPNRSKQLSHSHTGTDSDYETGGGGEMSLDEDEEIDEYDDDGAEFVDDEMNSLEDDDGSMSTGRMSVCSSFSNLSMADDEEEEDDEIDRDRNVHRSLGRVGSTSGLGVDQDGALPALWSSLFNYIPPTLYFHLEDEKVAKLPHDVRKILKWKPSTICPNVVKKLITRVGFRFSKRSNDWICYWGKHMKSDCFKNVKEYQRVNHFPGTFQIGRKDRLYRNLTRLQSRHGQKHFNFFPNTFILPQDLRQFKKTWDEGGYKHKWILKPPASARGIGIRVINKWNQIPKRRAIIVQKYIAKPFLINGSKFDMRVYCFVSSYDPLRVYVYSNGLARFCSMKYSNSVKSIGNKFMHLTNYSVNKYNNEYVSNDSSVKCEGHKWTLQALWGWMSRRGIDYKKIWRSIEDIVVKTIIASEYCVSGLTKANVKNRKSCYELFGFDIILDEHLRPWILEVNISPSLHSNSELDVTVKESMLRDLFNILGLTIPDKEEVASSGTKFHHKTKFLEEGKCIRDSQPTPNERAKHVYYMQRASDENIKSTILDILTAEDLRFLTETEDEMNKAGDFIRVFPSVNSNFYLKFLDHPPKYNNLLLDEWVRRYAYMPSRGIAILEHLCNMRAHLGEREDLCKWAPTSGLNVFRPLIAGSGNGAGANHNSVSTKSSRDHSTTRHGKKQKGKNGKQKALTADGSLNRHTVGPITLASQTDEDYLPTDNSTTEAATGRSAETASANRESSTWFSAKLNRENLVKCEQSEKAKRDALLTEVSKILKRWELNPPQNFANNYGAHRDNTGQRAAKP